MECLAKYPVGSKLTGKIIGIVPYGLWIRPMDSEDDEACHLLLEIIQIGDDPASGDLIWEAANLGDEITAVVIYTDPVSGARLSCKKIDFEHFGQ